MALASISLDGIEVERREGKPNTGFVGVMIGLVESDNPGRRSSSVADGGQNADVSKCDLEGTGVTEREGIL